MVGKGEAELTGSPDCQRLDVCVGRHCGSDYGDRGVVDVGVVGFDVDAIEGHGGLLFAVLDTR